MTITSDSKQMKPDTQNHHIDERESERHVEDEMHKHEVDDDASEGAAKLALRHR